MAEVRDLVAAVVEIDPAAQAIEEKGHWHSWGEFGRAVRSLDSLYCGLGLGSGARIAVFMRNRFGPLAALISAVATDRCLVTINPFYPDEVLADDIRTLRPPVVVAVAQDWQREAIRAAVKEIGAAGVELTGDAAEPARFVAGLDRIMATDLITTTPDVIIEMLTSGTTGKPKRVALRRAAFQFSFDQALAYERARESDTAPRLRSGVQIIHAPLSHISGIWGSINAIAAGRSICLLERFKVNEWHEAIVRHRPKVAGVPPTALRMILEAAVPKEDLSSLSAIVTGTAPVDPALTHAFWEHYGIPLLQTYGATEFSGAVAGWSISDFRANHERKKGAVGRIHKGVEARIVDVETGAVLPHGTEGLLELRSKQLADPESWVRTTDRGLLDEEGFLWIKGRADNAIVRGGFKVHPDDVVIALESHPAIREAAVVGIPDARLGEAPAAAIILRKDATAPGEAELTEYLKHRLLPYQVPVKFRFVEDMPRTTSLKPALPELRALLSA